MREMFLTAIITVIFFTVFVQVRAVCLLLMLRVKQQKMVTYYLFMVTSHPFNTREPLSWSFGLTVFRLRLL